MREIEKERKRERHISVFRVLFSLLFSILVPVSGLQMNEFSFSCAREYTSLASIRVTVYSRRCERES